MGYTIAAPTRRSETAGMMGFLDRNFRPLADVVERGGEIRGPLTEGFAYDHHKGDRIGFDYGPGYLAHDYAWAICGWVATKVGRQGRFDGALLPYCVYDGDQRCPIRSLDEWLPKSSFPKLAKKTPLALRMCVSLASFLSGDKADHRMIKDEVKRLDALWDRERRAKP